MKNNNEFDSLFAKEPASPPAPVLPPWKVLLVDDEPDVHAVLRLALQDFRIAGRGLHLLSAHSAAEARKWITAHPDTALILLDVVMENERAGIDFVHYVRETLGNRKAQIVLVTGQPGYAPQREVVVSCEIDGYLLKSELVADKLFVLVVAALRAHKNFLELEEHRNHLEALVQERTQALSRAKEAAETANNAKTEFLANMSHEIRTPLNSVLGLTRVLQEMPLEKRMRKFLDMIQSNGELLLSIVNDTLDISRLGAGTLVLRQEAFDLRGTLLEFCESSALRARQKGLSYTWEVASTVPDRVVGDAARLLQILHNFMNNAVKFTDKGAIHLQVTLAGEKNGAPLVRFAVRDSGIGIPPDKRDHLFERFHQVDASISRRFGGAGLGLAISREMALMMHGDIGVESVDGEGSTFWFTARLPLAPADSAVSNPAAISQSQPFPQFVGKILVAEDYLPNRIVIQEFLRLFGLECIFAENGREAIECLSAQPVDLVFMDVQMPEIDGLQATRRIRQGQAGDKMKDCPIIALTAHIHPEDRQQCLEAGMQDYLSKPIVMEALARALKKWLPRHCLA